MGESPKPETRSDADIVKENTIHGAREVIKVVQGTGRGTCSWIHSKLKVLSSGKKTVVDLNISIEYRREMAFIHK